MQERKQKAQIKLDNLDEGTKEYRQTKEKISQIEDNINAIREGGSPLLSPEGVANFDKIVDRNLNRPIQNEAGPLHGTRSAEELQELVGLKEGSRNERLFGVDLPLPESSQ
ncbi:MAG: hypothetical protein ABEI54_01695, partial [Candidatus Bipolaricaulia bacterium]